MKPKTINGKWIALTTLVALFALATPALAWWGYGPGYGMMGGGAPGPNLTGTQQKQVSAIQSKYQSQLDALQQKLNTKYSALAAARANDHTTVAQLKVLEGNIFKLENQYRTLLARANSELAQASGAPAGGTYRGGYYGKMGYGGYGMPGYMGGMMYGGNYGGGAPGSYGCGW